MAVWFCEGCGAALDAPWDDLAVVCGWCGAQNLPGGGVLRRVVPADGRPRLNLGGRTWVLESRLADGDSSVVYRGRWVVRLGELAVIKILAARGDDDLLRREWDTLRELCRSTVDGAAHFVTRLPAPIAHGLVDSDVPRRASVFGWRSGFTHTLEQVGEAHPSGVPGPVGVWLLKRLLELLGFLHRAGVVHGAVTPDHVLVHPRDHGAVLCGYTVAQPWSRGATRKVTARSARWRLDDGLGSDATPERDIAMACRCVRAVAGAGPDPVGALLTRGAAGNEGDAWALAERLVSASREVHGPAAYHPLALPGWG